MSASKIVAALLLLLAAVHPAAPMENHPGPYIAHVEWVIDGDTLRLRVKVWPLTEMLATVRLRGVNTPEKGFRAHCKAERVKGQRATAFVRRLFPKGAKVLVRNVRIGKYAGRRIADVYLPDGRSLAAVIIQQGLGRPYEGGRRRSWCQTPRTTEKEDRLK